MPEEHRRPNGDLAQGYYCVSIAELARLPDAERKRLEGLSLSALIAGVERVGFECEGGPLANFTEWTELKARIAELSRLVPRPIV